MEYLPILVSIVIIFLVAYFYKENAAKNKIRAQEEKDYKVPLSDDVQKMYYDHYEQELEKQKQMEEEEENDSF